jgi:hypothetical protein
LLLNNTKEDQNEKISYFYKISMIKIFWWFHYENYYKLIFVLFRNKIFLLKG